MAGELMVTVVGNLTADPELRYTANGLPVANFSIAQTERVWDRHAGAAKDGDSIFMRCSVWREFAEHVAQTVKKGNRVIAYGKLKQRSYQDREGNQRTAIELEVEAIGPDLRFATAVVTRAVANEHGTDWAAVNQPAQQQQTQPAATTTDHGWGPPGAYGEETPW